MPFAANPQLGAFYPLNFIFLDQPAWKALICKYTSRLGSVVM
jgi:hypothetical protein